MPRNYFASILRYGLALLSVAAAMAIRLALDPLLGDRFPFLAPFLAIVLTAWYGGVGPALLALVLAWISVDRFLLQPPRTLPFLGSKFQLAFVFFIGGLIVILLSEVGRVARRRARDSTSETRRALESLRAHRERLRITLASIGDAVITTDAEGCVDSLNPAAEGLTGWRADEARGRPLGEVFRMAHGTTDTAADLPIAEVVRCGAITPPVDHVVLIARDGTSRCIDLNPTPIKDDRGQTTGVVIIFRDISERQRVQEALRESELRFRQLADHITDVFWIFDPTAQEIVFVSPAYEEVWGRSCQSLYERPMSYIEAVHPEDRERVILAHQRLVGGEATADEYRIVRSDGTIRWVWDRGFPIRDESGRVVRIAGLAEDISGRKRVEQALREGEERFRTLADATPVLIWGSGTDRRCNYFNKRWLDFTGRAIEQEMGEGWSENVHPDDVKGCLETYVAAFDARTPFTMEYRLRRHDGQYRWVLDTGVPRFAPDGAFSGYIGSCLDFTDRKRAEEDLRKSDRRKEEFLAVLSHELRNPLAPIQTALDLMEQAGPGGAGSGQELAVIRRQVLNLKRLVDDLLDVSRISRGKIQLRKESVELAPVVARTVETVRPLLDEHHHRLHVSIPDAPILVEADPTRLEQILSNLLLNADKYTPQGGRVWLDVEPSQGEVAIRVRDTGIGIEPDLLPKVFDLFLQGERRVGLSHEGGGIGLSLAKNLVELHGGTITAHSRGQDMGSEFVVRLPATSVVRHETKPSPKAIRHEPPQPLPRRRILIVDDNVQAADSLGRLMSGAFGQEVRVVYNGKSALQVAGAFLPEVILLDLEMTGMDGYEVASRLRGGSACCEALIVAVTGWGHEEDRRRSREMGFDLHLVKPVTARDLRAMLADHKPKLEEHSFPELVPDLAPR